MIKHVITLLLAFALCVVAAAQDRPLKTKVDVVISGNNWTYSLKNNESATSPMRIGSLLIELDAPITSVVFPPGWEYATDYATYIVWYHLKSSPVSQMVAPGQTLNMGFTVGANCGQRDSYCLVQSWNDATQSEGRLYTRENLRTPRILRKIDAIQLNTSFVNGHQETTATMKVNWPIGDYGMDVKLEPLVPGQLKLPSYVPMAPGKSEVTFSIRGGDVDVNTSAQFKATLDSGGNYTRMIRVFPNPVTVVKTNRTSVLGGSAKVLTGQVALKFKPYEGAEVRLSCSDPTVLTLPAVVVVPKGEQNVTFNIQHAAIAANKVVTITATKGGQSVSVDVTITAK